MIQRRIGFAGDSEGRPVRGQRSCAGFWLGTVFAAAGLSLLLSAAAPAQVSVDCDDESDFCTGNPCTVSQELIITVALCDLDFGAADLILNEQIHVPNNGTLSLKAGSIDVNHFIRGRHSKQAEPDGADVTLIATTDITIDKRVDVSGRDSVGTITLDAGGNITLNRELRARTKGLNPTAVGGTVNVQAGGMLTSVKRGKVDVRGKKKETAAGTATLIGDAGASLKGRVEARGSDGGTIIIASTSGNLVLEEELRGQGKPGAGGGISVSAGGTITIQGRKGKAVANGFPGGNVSISAGGDITLNGQVRARGKGSSNGGTITIASATGDIVSPKRVDVKSNNLAGGSISFSGVNLTLEGAKDARGKTLGGTIEGTATNDLTATGNFKATPGGCIGLSAGGTLSTPGDFDPPFVASCP